MGGRAFPRLFCPRMRRELYLKARKQTFDALTKIFTHVTIPNELPSKTDFGDVDFLVAGLLDIDRPARFPWAQTVARIKHEFSTTHGRRGYLNEDCMYFAIAAPGREDEFFIQIDVKVCREPELFSWTDFQLKYASIGKIIGSMVRPLGLTINPEGLWIRVEEIEDIDSAGSMVFLTKDACDVLKIIGLDRRILNHEFLSNEDLYHHLASSFVFNPGHFAERLKDSGYVEHLRERSKAWVSFVTRWIPEQYPQYQLPTQVDNDVGHWYNIMRVIIRESALTMFPCTAQIYYDKRRTHLREVEEKRLRELIIRALPTGDKGWTHGMPQPHILTKSPEPEITNVELSASNIDNALIRVQNKSFLRSRNSEPESPASSISPTRTPAPSYDPFGVILYLEALPRPIPHGQEYVSRPPPSNMSQEAKLLCLARWTLFHPESGTLYLAKEPREKKFEMCWINSGATDDTLVQWARDMWWVIWHRQHRVNWNGMWRHKMIKEDNKVAKKATERAATATALTGAEPEEEQRSGDYQELRCLVRTKSSEHDRSEVEVPADLTQHEAETTETACDDRCSAESHVHSGPKETVRLRKPDAWRKSSRWCTILAEEELTGCKGSQRSLEHTSRPSRSRSDEDLSSRCHYGPDEAKSISIRDLKRKADALHCGRAKSRRQVEDVNGQMGVLIFE